MNQADIIRRHAEEQGFDLVGIAPAAPFRHAEVFRRRLNAEFAADRAWIGRETSSRTNPAALIGGARSIRMGDGPD